ncbi:hypothetical protein J1N35_014561 [Gossypium stocksii]|uniref:Uncharacterized protein n=1 Tax=Gossypium stocksii TaxID=47602 RepID=A0A9D4A916_9ROSI|nr:hypothetical protein J1N35_014561 [Gossypium stocksii]
MGMSDVISNGTNTKLSMSIPFGLKDEENSRKNSIAISIGPMTRARSKKLKEVTIHRTNDSSSLDDFQAFKAYYDGCSNGPRKTFQI